MSENHRVNKYPNWQLLCNHIGQHCGPEIIKGWIKETIVYPTKRTPLLFIYGPKYCGKSIFHNAMSHLMRRVYCDDLVKHNRFNHRLVGANLCVLEESNLGGYSGHNDLSAWLTEDTIVIDEPCVFSYETTNVTHWIQIAESIDEAPSTHIIPNVLYAKITEPIGTTINTYFLKELEEEKNAFLTYGLGIKGICDV